MEVVYQFLLIAEVRSWSHKSYYKSFCFQACLVGKKNEALRAFFYFKEFQLACNIYGDSFVIKTD